MSPNARRSSFSSATTHWQVMSFLARAVCAKAKFDNMPVEILKAWKEAYDA